MRSKWAAVEVFMAQLMTAAVAHACSCGRMHACVHPYLNIHPRVQERLRHELAHDARARVAVGVPRVKVKDTPLFPSCVHVCVFGEMGSRGVP